MVPGSASGQNSTYPTSPSNNPIRTGQQTSADQNGELNTNAGFNGGSRAQTTGQKPGIIRDCAVETCVVNGRDYANNLQIPGNEPVPVTGADGAQVLNSAGNPMLAPSRANMDKVADELKSDFMNNKEKFRRGGEWDFQRMRDDHGNVIFTAQYCEFANVIIGYAYAASGIGWTGTAFIGDIYARDSHFGNAPMNPVFRYLPQALVYEFKTGAELWVRNQVFKSPPDTSYRGPL